MPLSWNEIRHRAIAFANEWQGETRESAERQSFWNEFFEVFGVRRRTVASFEEPVRKLSGNWGSIDLFWPGKLLVEHKSAGEDLGKAHAQGMAYIRGLHDSGREKEVPRYLIVSDFGRIALHNLEPEEDPLTPLFPRFPATIEFTLGDLHRHIQHFAFIAGYTQRRLNPEDPANFEATALMCQLYDELELGRYDVHDLRRFLVRILFCLFADDTGVFPPKAFELYLRDRTAEDGSDLGEKLERLFRVLDTPTESRQSNLDESLREFPYVNGDLFRERLEIADCNQAMRARLLACCGFRWEQISPAVFGSLFQSVMDDRERRQIGAHYTAEKNILKLIRPLFLDGLEADFDNIRADRSTRRTARLAEFHDRLAGLRFFDPACGCGNFLVIAYRELRRLELELLLELYGAQREFSFADANALSRLNVHQFYGIEIEEFPARIAEVALWLADHQANVALSVAFSQLVLRLPLRESPHIVVDNALRRDWHSVLPSDQCSYVLGNPPFVGKHLMTAQQSEDMELVWGGSAGAGVLDYVTGWYRKAAGYVQGTRIVIAFVSTNSITQGEQPGPLWTPLFALGLTIHFAHRTFDWESEARGQANVHVVIIGFAAFDIETKRIYEQHGESEVTVTTARNISPYLVEGSNVAAISRTHPLCDVPACIYGNKPTDGGHLIIEEDDRPGFLAENPAAAPYVRPLICSDEYLYSIPRWCLWLVDAPPSDIRSIPGIKRRVAECRAFRLASRKEPTRRKAEEPTLFAEIRQPTSRYLVIPQHTSENRKYVPFGYFGPDVIIHNSCSAVPNATPYHFGVLSSVMHMAWFRHVCGRIESRYRYSTKIVYNNFPWPEAPTDRQRAAVEAAASRVLEARTEHHGATLADLYDPLSMPPALTRAHADLDRAVDLCYRPQPFAGERQRVEFLFGLYARLTSPLLPIARPVRAPRPRR